MKIAIVAGEQSGDELGAALMQSLLAKQPNIEFFGVGGEKMIALGLHSLFSQDRLAVMGFVEPLKRLPDLFKAKNSVIQACVEKQPDLFLGIDSPDFNLRIAKTLKNKGFKTAHYVSPSVWAWRQGRIKGIRQSIDLMLTLFPFEVEFYQKHNVPALHVGHPLADRLSVEILDDEEIQRLRNDFNVTGDYPLVTLMPGSRGGEVSLMGELFLDVAQKCADKNPELQFFLPAANTPRMKQLEIMLQNRSEKFRKKVHLIQGQAHHAMQISSAVLLASGTSSLEAMLLKKPMIVAYRLANMTYSIVKHLVKTPYISLPNLIANEAIVPEFIQDEASLENLSQSLLELLEEENRQQLEKKFTQMHQDLRLNASDKSATALLELIAQA